MTGASGFLGRHILEYLNEGEQNSSVVPLVRDKTAWEDQEWNQGLGCGTVVEGSIAETEDWVNDPAIKKIDGIFHLAALVRHSRTAKEEVYETNIEGTLNMVRLAATKKCRMVYVSTSGTVGVFDTRNQWADEHGPYQDKQVAKWPYYDSKVKAERAARKLADELGVTLVILRPPAMLGPGDHRFRSTSHVIRYLRGKLPFLIRGGIHFVDIRDAAVAMVCAMQHVKPKPAYNLSGVACTIDSFFKMVEDASGVKPPKMHLPRPIALAIANTSKGMSKVIPGVKESPLPDPVVIEMAGKYWDVRSRYAAKDLGFVNRNGQDTINDTVRWLLDHHEGLKS
jgi:nucleoside-diphosphate-sugar epimerase